MRRIFWHGRFCHMTTNFFSAGRGDLWCTVCMEQSTDPSKKLTHRNNLHVEICLVIIFLLIVSIAFTPR